MGWTRLVILWAAVLMAVSAGGVVVVQRLAPATGDILLLTVSRFTSPHMELLLLDVKHGSSHLLTHNKSLDFNASWSPDGERILFVGTRMGGYQLFQTATNGTDQRLLNNTTRTLYTEVSPVVWSPDSRWMAYFADEEATFPNLQRYDTTTDTAQTLYTLSGEDLAASPEWVQRSERLFFLDSSDTNVFHLSIFDIESGQVTTLLPGTEVLEADLSPDGTWIAYSAEDGSPRSEVFIMPVDGDEPQNISNDPFVDNGPVWSPDGRTVAYLSNRSRDWHITLYDVDTATTRQITTQPASLSYDLAWSPDSQWIAFVSDRDLYRAHVETGAVEALPLPDGWVMSFPPYITLAYKP